jgi:hypothetical protein
LQARAPIADIGGNSPASCRDFRKRGDAATVVDAADMTGNGRDAGPRPQVIRAFARAANVELENGDGLRLKPRFTGFPLTAARPPSVL